MIYFLRRNFALDFLKQVGSEFKITFSRERKNMFMKRYYSIMIYRFKVKLFD